jgi:hypothetical protein
MLPKRVLAFIVPTFCFCLLVAMASGVSADPIAVDEILREQGQSSDPSLLNLVPNVEMSFKSATNLLTVILSNEASYEGEPDAGHLLTGLGFNLPPGVSIQDTSGQDSSISLPDESVIIYPNGTIGISLSQDNWGFANHAMGHFSTEAQSTVGTVLSCMNADSEVTFAGNAASNALMDAFDYGLQGQEPTPGHPTKATIRNGLVFSLYLDGPTGTEADLVSYVGDHAVVVSYGSPTGSIIVPEPATSSTCIALLAALVIFRLRRRRAG